MAYAHRNLKDVKDSAVDFGLSPDLEARFASGDLGLTQSGMSYQRYLPGVRSGFGHRQATQEELYVVLSGGGRAKVGDDLVELKPLDALRVDADTMRAFEAGDDGLELLAFGAPATGPGDAELTPGWWDE